MDPSLYLFNKSHLWVFALFAPSLLLSQNPLFLYSSCVTALSAFSTNWFIYHPEGVKYNGPYVKSPVDVRGGKLSVLRWISSLRKQCLLNKIAGVVSGKWKTPVGFAIQVVYHFVTPWPRLYHAMLIILLTCPVIFLTANEAIAHPTLTSTEMGCVTAESHGFAFKMAAF